MIWVKALHIIFVICWFAGIFYLPRLFVNHAMSESTEVHTQLTLMERKLYRFTTLLAGIAVTLGLILTVDQLGYFLGQTWFQVKLVLICLLIIYHFQCGRLCKQFAEGVNVRSHIYFRWFNEVPVLFLTGIVILITIRPF